MNHSDILNEEEQEIVRRGLAAASLLDNPTFNEVIQSLAIETFSRFTETSLTQKEDREAIFHFYAGLKAIEDELRNRIHQKDRIAERLDADNEPDDYL